MDPREKVKERAVRDAALSVRKHMELTLGSSKVELIAPGERQRNIIRMAINDAAKATGLSRKRTRKIMAKAIREIKQRDAV